MKAVVGTYDNGIIKLDRDYSSAKPVRVIITFLEEIESSEKGHKFSDFSFSKSQKNLISYNGSLSDEIIKERRQ